MSSWVETQIQRLSSTRARAPTCHGDVLDELADDVAGSRVPIAAVDPVVGRAFVARRARDEQHGRHCHPHECDGTNGGNGRTASIFMRRSLEGQADDAVTVFFEFAED